MTDKELMQQALEALKMCRALIRINIERLVPIESPNPWFFRDIDHTIAALRERLAQPEQSYPDNFIDALKYDVAKRDSEAQQAYEDAFVNGTGVMIGDKRIDPTSIYKETEQEPVAWADLNALTEQFNSVNCGTAYRLPGEGRQPLYTSPQPAQQQEPVAYVTGYFGGNALVMPTNSATVLNNGTALYTTPPQRKPLTDEDRAILEAVRREMDDSDDGNAPGHGHLIPGIWDEDNGDLAGKPCAWCLTWAKFTALIAAHGITGEQHG